MKAIKSQTAKTKVHDNFHKNSDLKPSINGFCNSLEGCIQAKINMGVDEACNCCCDFPS